MELKAYRVVCVKHPGGPLVLQVGIEPAIETECYQCQEPRIERARLAASMRNAPDPFKGFREGD